MIVLCILTVGSRWSSNDLTYGISKYTEDMSEDVVDSEIQRAFDVSILYTYCS